MKSKKIDLIVHNAIIHTLDETNVEFEAMAILGGKILEVGPERQILNKYRAEKIIDARGRHIYPGLTDSHGHLKLAATSRMGIDLKGMKSFEQILFKLEQFHAKYPNEPIIARGWSELDWLDQNLPTNEKINTLFPNIPVCLFRIDEHAALANNYLLQAAKIDENTKIEGGEIFKINGILTGLLADQALERLRPFLPRPTEEDLTNGLLELQEELFMYGITTVHDAGFEDGDYAFYKNLVDLGKWHLQTHGMFLPTKANFELAKHGKLDHKNLQVGTFKFFLDGSLGAHGALLKQPYSDLNTYGTLAVNFTELEKQLLKVKELGYQAAFHAIGDSAVKIAIDYTQKLNNGNPDHRWRLEHGIVIDPTDYEALLNSGLIPSFQPLQASSDASFLAKRLGDIRLKSANAFQTILNQTGIIILGSDFPIESFNIQRTIHASLYSTPRNESITIENCLKGLTIWPAIAVFEERNTGTLEVNKDATFVIFSRALTQYEEFSENFAMHTFIKGKEVYSAE